MTAAVGILLCACLGLDAETGRRVRYTNDLETHPVALAVSNATAAAEDVVGSVVLSNYFGETVSVAVKTNLPSGGVARYPVDLKGAASVARRRGIWHVSARLSANGREETLSTSFAYLPKNAVTPRIPRGNFRIGLQYHMGKFPDEQQADNVDALVALGCKLARVGGFHAHPCWKDPKGLPDFSRADRFMALLKASGIAVNVFCWPNADWMAEDKDRRRPYPAYIRSRPKKGLMGRYAELLAARYGGDIDYIEPSNEPDFWDKDAMTIDDYIDYQREVYEGVKRGSKDILVLTPGWAQPDSSHPRTVLKGFQERVLAEAKGSYDVHAIHGHGWFPDYEKLMTERFFPLREKLGVTAPWYANETAATSVNGAEDAVARTVWQKVLWSRAHGSVDYIWYNLIATGTDPRDSEQGFGLLSRDLHPRSGFAAFAALTHLLNGLSFDAVVHEGHGRYLYRWKGEVNGRVRTVLVGWDEYADTPAEIPVRTDAAAAATYDLMGNAARVSVTDGAVRLSLSPTPGALVLDGARRVEPDPAALKKASVPARASRTIVAYKRWRPPDFQLMTCWQVHEIYAANWETADRVWKGMDDLSANIYLGYYEKGVLRVFFELRDDVTAPKDGVWFMIEPPDRTRRLEFRSTFAERGRRDEKTGRVHYEFKLPIADLGLTEEMLAKGFYFQAKVFDDDGLGDDVDFWMETREVWVNVDFNQGGKDVK